MLNLFSADSSTPLHAQLPRTTRLVQMLGTKGGQADLHSVMTSYQGARPSAACSGTRVGLALVQPVQKRLAQAHLASMLQPAASETRVLPKAAQIAQEKSLPQTGNNQKRSN